MSTLGVYPLHLGAARLLEELVICIYTVDGRMGTELSISIHEGEFLATVGFYGNAQLFNRRITPNNTSQPAAQGVTTHSLPAFARHCTT